MTYLGAFAIIAFFVVRNLGKTINRQADEIDRIKRVLYRHGIDVDAPDDEML